MKLRHKKLTLVKSSVLEAYEKGTTLRELAHIYEVSPGTVRNFLISEDVPMRKRGRKKKEV